MKPSPINGNDFNNIKRVIGNRKLNWETRLKREQWLEEVCAKVIRESKTEEVLWLARVFDHPDIMSATSITVKWKLHYPYVIGDPEYDKEAEVESDLTACSIFFNIRGSSEEEFEADIHFDYVGKSGIMSDEVKLAVHDFAFKKIEAPEWFGALLHKITENNSKFYKR